LRTPITTTTAGFCTLRKGVRVATGFAITFLPLRHTPPKCGVEASQRRSGLHAARCPNGHGLHAGLVRSSSRAVFGPTGSGVERWKARGQAVGRQRTSDPVAVGVGPPSRKAQGVGGRSESSRSRWSYAGEAIVAKNHDVQDSARGANYPAIP